MTQKSVTLLLLALSISFCQSLNVKVTPDSVDYTDIGQIDEAYTYDKLVNGENGTIDVSHLSASERPANAFFNDTTRILGGTAATAGQFPYFAFIVNVRADGKTINCGGGILSENWVITAATCVILYNTLTVYGGLTAPPAMSDVGVAGVSIVHPYFRANYAIHNIALIRLLKPLTFSGTVSIDAIVRLSKSTLSLDNVSVRVIGLGGATNTESAGTALNYVDLINLRRDTCNLLTDGVYVTYPPTAGCLGTQSSTKNFCWADKGGPVVFNFDDIGVALIGITSEFIACPSAFPSAYTKVGPYLKWIRDTTRRDFT